MLDTKKGQANALMQAGLTFVFVGVVLAFGLYVQNEFRDNSFAGTQTNQTITVANWTYVPLNYRAKGTVTLMNTTATWPGANVSQTNAGQTTSVRAIVDLTMTAGDYNASYRALDDTGSLAISNATSGIGTLASWLPIIAVVIAAATVLAYLFSTFRGGF